MHALVSLEELRIGLTGISDQSCRELAKFTKLSNLSMAKCEITDAGLEALGSVITLSLLDITGCKQLTESGVRKLQAELPNCKIVSDFPDVGPPAIAATTTTAINYADEREAAEWVRSIGGEVQVVDPSGIVHPGTEVPAQPFYIRHIHLSGNNKVSDADMAKLQQCKQLQTLILDGSSIDGSGLQYLSNLPRLNSLNIAGTKVKDEHLKYISDMKSIRDLGLVNTQTTGAGLKHLRDLEKHDAVGATRTY